MNTLVVNNFEFLRSLHLEAGLGMDHLGRISGVSLSLIYPQMYMGRVSLSVQRRAGDVTFVGEVRADGSTDNMRYELYELGLSLLTMMMDTGLLDLAYPSLVWRKRKKLTWKGICQGMMPSVD